jgi:hypothetical protein
MGKTIVINQPYYFPKLHWWKRVSDVDVVVLLNDVSHNTNYPVNRALLFDGKNEKYLTIPIKRKQRHSYINEIEINNNLDWIYNHEQLVSNYYKKYKYFSELDFYFNHLNNVRLKIKDGDNLLINVIKDSITEVVKSLNLPLSFIDSEDINIQEKKNDRLVSICKKLKSNNLILGLGSKNYVDLEMQKYIDNNINIVYQDWKCPVKNYSILHSIAEYGIEETRKLIM